MELEVRAAWAEWTRVDHAARISRKQLESATASYEQRVRLCRGGEATRTDDRRRAQPPRCHLKSVNARIDRRVALARLRHAAAMGASEKNQK